MTKRLASGFELDANLRVPLAEAPVTVLFGPSGAGKTTLLRLIAGLERPDAGEIRYRGEIWSDSSNGSWRTPQQRRTGFLFQDYALFPHLTVAANVAYAARHGKARELLASFGLLDLAPRHPRQLSGGQQQRVALARALAAEPALLLLDEPLSALDSATRLRTRQELRRALAGGGVPSIVVTHDRAEAVALGDWMAVIVDGRIRQAAPVREVFRRPADAQVAECVGVENVLAAELVSSCAGLLTLRVGALQLECVESDLDRWPSEARLWACVRAEDITLSREPARDAVGQVSRPVIAPNTSARNHLRGRVVSVEIEGPLARVELDCGFPLVAAITAQSSLEMGLTPGEEVCAVVKATAVHLIPAGPGPRT